MLLGMRNGVSIMHWGGNADAARAVQQTSDGGYIVAGRANVPPADQDMYVVKTNSLGQIE